MPGIYPNIFMPSGRTRSEDDMSDVPSGVMRHATFGDEMTPEMLYELAKRDNLQRVAMGAQMTESAGNVSQIILSAIARNADAASKLAKTSRAVTSGLPLVSTASNVVQGVATVKGGVDPYGSKDLPSWWTPAIDAADSAPSIAGAYVGSLLGPPGAAAGSFIGQTFGGGAASQLAIRDQTEKNRKVFLNKPTEADLIGRTAPDHGRNQFSQIWNSRLNERQAQLQSNFESVYLAAKQGGAKKWVLDGLLKKHGDELAAYDDAQNNMNWMQKSYYSIKDMVGTDGYGDFVAKGRVDRKEQDAFDRAAAFEVARQNFDHDIATNPRDRKLARKHNITSSGP
jgi:hypothetical protein